MATTVRRTAAALFEQLHEGTLDEWLLEQRQAKRPLRAMADELRVLTGGAIDVSAQTVLNWSNEAEDQAVA